MGLGVGQHFEGARLQGVAGENGSGLVEGAVRTGLSTAQVVIVHCWQIVMY